MLSVAINKSHFALKISSDKFLLQEATSYSLYNLFYPLYNRHFHLFQRTARPSKFRFDGRFLHFILFGFRIIIDEYLDEYGTVFNSDEGWQTQMAFFKVALIKVEFLTWTQFESCKIDFYTVLISEVYRWYRSSFMQKLIEPSKSMGLNLNPHFLWKNPFQGDPIQVIVAIF